MLAKKESRNAVLTEEQQLWNKRMSSARVSVEWLFGDIINYLKFLDFQKKLYSATQCCRQNVSSWNNP